ncbi:MAG TPA: hypothetical protein VHW72_03230 [Candidatus Angelobacter sp.]|jgi:hypothetical protein|nr:hypothetical protein [Candidatus Angelobacter sp.]
MSPDPCNDERAIATWLALKDVLRTKLPVDEWELWVFPARLLAVSPACPGMSGCALDTLIVALPRNGRAVWKANMRKDLVRRICLNANYHIFFVMAPADYEQARAIERRGEPFTFLDPEPSKPLLPGSRPAGSSRAARSRQPFLKETEARSGPELQESPSLDVQAADDRGPCASSTNGKTQPLSNRPLHPPIGAAELHPPEVHAELAEAHG